MLEVVKYQEQRLEALVVFGNWFTLEVASRPLPVASRRVHDLFRLAKPTEEGSLRASAPSSVVIVP